MHTYTHTHTLFWEVVMGKGGVSPFPISVAVSGNTAVNELTTWSYTAARH